MPKKPLIKKLLERKVPHILGSYFIAGTSFILFIEYLVDKYQVPSHYPTLSLFALIGILPSVIILTYFHGAPGKDEWTMVEKIGIPINILFIAGILFLGDGMDFWGINNNSIDNNLPNVHLIYISSSEEDYGSCYNEAENILIKNKGSALFTLSESKLNTLRKKMESNLFSEFYNQNLTIQVIKDNDEINFIKDAIKENNNHKIRAKKIYDFFDKPKHIAFARVFSIKSITGEIIKYVGEVHGGLGKDFTNIFRTKFNTNTIKVMEEHMFDLLVGHVTRKENLKAKGKVVKVDGDYIYINPGGLTLKKNMNLIGYTLWSHNDKNGDGLTDKDSNYYKWINDVKRALDYTKNSEKYNIDDINYYQKHYDRLTSDSLRSTAKGERWIGQFSYNLNVIDIKDTIAITKLIELAHPWVEINIGDGVQPDY